MGWLTYTTSTGGGGGGGGGGTAATINADDSEHRPLTGPKIQDQLDRADSLLRFTLPGSPVFTYRQVWDAETAYFPGDAVRFYDTDVSSWYLFACVDVPGAPSAGNVGVADITDDSTWVGICQGGPSAAPIDLRATDDEQPNTGEGIPAPVGSTLRLQRSSGQVGALWVKVGPTDTAWADSSAQATHEAVVWNEGVENDTLAVYQLTNPDDLTAWGESTNSRWGYVVDAVSVGGYVHVNATLIFTTGDGFNAGQGGDPSTLGPGLSFPEIKPTYIDALGGYAPVTNAGVWLDTDGNRIATSLAVSDAEGDPAPEILFLTWQDLAGSPATQIEVPMEATGDELQIVFAASFSIPGTIVPS